MVAISRSGVNYDDYLIGRTCRRCGRLMLEGTATPLPDDGRPRIVVRTADGMPNVLKGSEAIAATCRACGAAYCIILYGPAQYGSAGIVAYTIIEAGGGLMADALAGGLEGAVRAVNDRGVVLVDEDWAGATYGTGWIEDA